ncbi:unnamed protein product [Microthlaspi erraticum]|uniref:Uncharacterized protein n=1 Tax=Microthlaspi erraticum TaxID=1685480 RepID=A0A6D2K6S6_9BRAS|nr:unnamed protein product [Microthlaspi erraticum]
MLHVEVRASSTQPTAQVSRAEKESSVGVNYIDEIGEKEEDAEYEEEAEKEAQEMDEDDVTGEYRHNEYDEPPVVLASQYTEPWEDGLNVRLLQEFPNKKAVQRMVDKAAFENSFGFVLVKSDKEHMW